MLAVVEYEQAFARAQHLQDRVLDRAAPTDVHIDRGCDRVERRVLVDDAHELDQDDAVGVTGRDTARDLETKRRLADTSGSDQRDEPMRDRGLDEKAHQ